MSRLHPAHDDPAFPGPPISRPAFVRALLADYDARSLTLPWRARAGERPAPYRVWMAEVMLQQTTVAAASGHFARFVARWPNIDALAAAADEEVMAAWAGLGYYVRARNMLACARRIVADHGGVFPDTEDGLRTLPGVGAYTAAAVAAIAFGRRAVVVDGNVERVVTRLFTIDTPLPAARREIAAAAASLTPDARAGDYAQAMMDLGRTVCRPRAADCPHCPVRQFCRAVQSGSPEQWPRRAPRAVRPERTGDAWWIERKGCVWLVRRPATGLLAGMRALPSSGWDGTGASAFSPGGRGGAGERGTGGRGSGGRMLGTVHQIFTHFRLTLRVHALTPDDRAARALLSADGEWWPVDRLEAAGLPSAFRKAADMAVAVTR